MNLRPNMSFPFRSFFDHHREGFIRRADGTQDLSARQEYRGWTVRDISTHVQDNQQSCALLGSLHGNGKHPLCKG